MLRAVLDTNVLVAAFRSKTGASFEIFRQLRIGAWTPILSNHLVHEYEEVLKQEPGYVAAQRALAELRKKSSHP